MCLISKHTILKPLFLGNRVGLLELKNAIDKALETGSSSATLLPSDYEGYDVYIALVDDEQRFEKLTTPYVEEYVQRGRCD
ncbi:hypothetical protein BSAF29S_01830 [Bacillus safensis subsp. safensis]